jgi:L-lactate dehydrogenase (cytochrome)
MLFNKGIHSSSDARRLAKRRLPWMVFDYFDGASGEGLGDTLNVQKIRELRLESRALRNVAERSLSTTILDQHCNLPFGIAPMGMCNLSRPGADLMLARLAAEQQIPHCVSTAASTSLEKIISEAEGNAWFQLYFGGDEAVCYSLMDRAQTSGYEVLTLTVDVPEVGRRPRELRHGFKMPFKIGPSQFIDFALHPFWSIPTLFSGAPALANFSGASDSFDRTRSRAGADWDFLARVRDRWKGKLIVKGVLNTEDAKRIQSAGADAIQVSSHGGRQMESVKPAIHALREIRQTLGDEFPLIYDSGIRSGEDICKAYAMGASFVMLGRPLLFAIAANGERGLQELIDVFKVETSLTLAQLGKVAIAELDRSVIHTQSV